MKIKIVSRKGGSLRFLLENATPAFANALRRVMVSEIPNLAIDVVEFQDNNSALFDEVIAHRLGLIPLQFDPKKFNFTGECKCGGKGCPLCEVVFTLEKTGPETVYSSDLKSSNRSVKPALPDLPIVKLLKDQHIKLEAKARLGRGREHAKFQAANVTYSYLPFIEVSQVRGAERIAKACPKGVLGVRKNKMVLLDPLKCDECRVCEDESGKGVKIKSDPTRFVFSVESISGLETDHIVEESARILQEKAREFRDQLKEA